MSSAEAIVCAVCLGDIHRAATTSCGHSFCAACLLEHLRRTSPRACPVCRKMLTGASPSFALRQLESARNLPSAPPSSAPPSAPPSSSESPSTTSSESTPTTTILASEAIDAEIQSFFSHNTTWSSFFLPPQIRQRVNTLTQHFQPTPTPTATTTQTPNPNQNTNIRQSVIVFLLVTCFAYILLPIDLIPDTSLAGYIDDVLIAFLLCYFAFEAFQGL
eukprot:c7517_g1_i2.p1 GENE.c7517_g1_i2~~c7517_g1_i2.p1  ORF type:complete len:218 (+),score=48.34 c7517_g1_i2:24-677(+)